MLSRNTAYSNRYVSTPFEKSGNLGNDGDEVRVVNEVSSGAHGENRPSNYEAIETELISMEERGSALNEEIIKRTSAVRPSWKSRP